MSYDLQVFAQQELDAADLRGLLAASRLATDGDGEDVGSLTVVRGARRRYSFTAALPVRVEAEDVPDEVLAVALEPAYLYEVSVEGSATAEVPHAIRFARRLAEASAGAVLDQQSGEVWARGKLRAAPPVPRGTTDIVEVTWYVRPDGAGAPAASAWLELARRHLPEALPRRFGHVEPLPMRLDRDGPAGFVEAVATDQTFFATTTPCTGGALTDGPDHPVGTAVGSHSLSVHRQALAQPGWRAGLQRLFLDFAATTQSVYASAEVQRGVLWNGRSASYDDTVERTLYLAPSGRWAGLPPYPVWWSWFGPEYVPLVLDSLPSHQVHRVGDSAFHPRADEPQDRDQLAAALRPSPTPHERERHGAELAPPTSWLPMDLLAAEDRSDPDDVYPPARRAATLPPGLRLKR